MPHSPWIICRIIPILKISSHNLHKFPIFRSISLASFSTSNPKISIFDYLVHQHNFSPECASKVSSSLSSNFINKPLNADSVLDFLKETGFSKDQIEVVVQKASWVLSTDLERTIKPKFEVFQDLGFQSADLAHIISASPWLLRISADRIRQSILGLKSVLGTNVDICRFFKTSGCRWFLKRDLESTLLPNIEYLKSSGIFSLHIATYVCRFPIMFLSNQEKLKGIVQRVDEMGVDKESKMFLCAVRVVSSVSRENWEMKLKLFTDLGFSEQNILYAFRVCPTAFATSEKKIKEVTELLLSVEDISYIARNLTMLIYNVEKRLKPRLRVLKALLSKNLLKKNPSLSGFLRITNAEFINKYVSPYSSEVATLYVA